MTDLSDDELFRVMVAKLRQDIKPTTPGLSEQQKRQAVALAGRATVARVLNAREGRRVRPIPVIVHYERVELSGGPHALSQWRVDRMENGQCIQHWMVAYHGAFEQELFRLRGAGASIRRGQVGFDPVAEEKPRTHARKGFADRYPDLPI